MTESTQTKGSEIEGNQSAHARAAAFQILTERDMTQAASIAAEAISIVWAMDVCTQHQIVLDKARFIAPKSLVYTNVLDYNEEFGRHLHRDIYVERVCNVDAISICQMPIQTIVYGGGDFVTSSNGHILADQAPPYFSGPDALLKVVTEPREQVAVCGPHLLVARFGDRTWGHWLVDILPRIVIAESFFPKRFQYVVPDNVIQDSSPARRRVLESLHAYGIQEDRLLGISPDRNYVFDDLSMITPIRSDHMMHPAAHNLMNRRLALSPRPPTKRVAILRTDSSNRNVTNLPDVRDELIRHGFDILSISEMTFLDQVACFQEAGHVVGVLGSGLTGLLYSPYGVKVMTIAPRAFGDRFFFGLTQMRNGHYVDLRGPVTVRDAGAPDRNSHFEIEIAEIRRGLQEDGTIAA